MRLAKVPVQNYRCVHDTRRFDLEEAKTILVGSNEAGKTAPQVETHMTVM